MSENFGVPCEGAPFSLGISRKSNQEIFIELEVPMMKDKEDTVIK